MFSFFICISLFTITGCNNYKTEISAAQSYILGTYGEWGNQESVSLNDIANDLLKNVSWKAKKIDDEVMVTMQAKFKTDFDNPVITKAIHSVVGSDIKATFSFNFLYSLGFIHFIGGQMTYDNTTVEMTRKEGEELFNSFITLEEALRLANEVLK